MESFGIQLEGVVILLYSCVKNHVIMHTKKQEKSIFQCMQIKKKKKDNSKLQNILNFKVARCLANIHDFVNGSE